MVAAHAHPVRWLAPAPLWPEVGALSVAANRDDFTRPAILRFANDEFVDEYLGVLSYHPERLVEWVAQSETWRDPSPTPETAGRFTLAEPRSITSRRLVTLGKRRGDIVTTTGGTGLPQLPDDLPALKLYQPAQQRFYLVTASLVCQQAGLPDRAVDGGKQEATSFVVRRLLPPDKDTIPQPDGPNTQELAFVATATGPRWVPAPGTPDAPALAQSEQRLPLFTTTYDDDQRGRKRRVLGGLIPVARREAYLGAPLAPADLSEPPTDATLDARLVMFDADVAAPWRNMIEQAHLDRVRIEDAIASLNASPPQPPLASEFSNPPDSDTTAAALLSARESIQTISWYVLIDFAAFIKKHWEGTIWAHLIDDSALTDDDEIALVERLKDFEVSSALATALENVPGQTREAADNLFLALREIARKPDIASKLERIEKDYRMNVSGDDWPGFLFPLADPALDAPIPDPVDGPSAEPERSLAVIAELAGLVDAALPLAPEQPQPATASAAQVPVDPERVRLDQGYFVLRCVYERPNCKPFLAPVVSAPSEMFEMASFFDSDAPARPIRIPMPVDVSPAGLRKYAKNTTFLISDSLCGQIDRFRGLTLGDLVLSVLPWPFRKDLPSVREPGPCKQPNSNPLGLFCSLSIPIVTLCALILLFIMVALFDLFFRWLPLLITCFPIPGFKGKKT